MTEPSAHLQWLASLSALRDRALAAPTLEALGFSMANDLHPLLRFRQALVLAQQGDRLSLLCVSGLARPTEDSPYLVWLKRAGRWLSTQLPDGQPRWLARDALALPDDIAEGWAEWWPAGLWCIPMHDREGHRLGLLVFLLDQPPAEQLRGLLQGVWQTWAHCWAAFAARRRLPRWRPSRSQWLIGLAVLAALLLLPVSQTTLAPAEVVSMNAQVVSSPIDGVIQRMQVRPNQAVDVGTPLFLLDETTLRNRADVLGKEVAVADAELQAASQRAFDNPQSKNELTLLGAQARQRRAELAAVEAQLKRTQVLSPRAGVAVFSDPDDWLGKPVVTGERILHVADPTQPGMRVQLPVADAIAIEPGAPVTLFLTAHPLDPLHGRILETSYQARTSDEGVASYRLLASIEGTPAHARLGLHGTAKLQGERVVLGYYLLRRPLAALRAWTGW
ncbi:HlyD family efflux transporter periplasmic adaptor subunit [Variovorax sp. J22P271]|uniref:efflux RND transporter periplasmic adaptor subunit n=1 Tax=Variovorax davisae TaxID=3053515 RepID=UPI0025777847|nr:HlyD family efflux transporter periplasmic adaptor subunit [Variovorax sp. J22P271]MDM0034489.1 HlyD family efflux transporter periplasmic adaptor subunit [Variovorax sp. J22P271]